MNFDRCVQLKNTDRTTELTFRRDFENKFDLGFCSSWGIIESVRCSTNACKSTSLSPAPVLFNRLSPSWDRREWNSLRDPECLPGVSLDIGWLPLVGLWLYEVPSEPADISSPDPALDEGSESLDSSVRSNDLTGGGSLRDRVTDSSPDGRVALSPLLAASWRSSDFTKLCSISEP